MCHRKASLWEQMLIIELLNLLGFVFKRLISNLRCLLNEGRIAHTPVSNRSVPVFV